MPSQQLLPRALGRSGFLSTGFDSLHRQVDRLFEDFHRGMGLPAADRAGFNPTLDVAETAEALTVTAELPGLEEKDVAVTLAGDRTITVSGSKEDRRETQQADYRLVERSFGSFSRVIPIGFDADPSTVTAEFAKGVLTVTVPKPPEAKTVPKKIEIKAAH